MENSLSLYSKEIKENFEKNKSVLSFTEYLDLAVKKPKIFFRTSSEVLLDAIEYFGVEEKDDGVQFNSFKEKVDNVTFAIIGQNQVQKAIYQTLKSFRQSKSNNRMILLYGPNGSAKTSITKALMRTLERYSKTPDGAVYKFSWIFPKEGLSRSRLGITSESKKQIVHYAHLTDDEIASKISSEMRDHPIYLLPKNYRLKWFKDKKIDPNLFGSAITEGELSPRSKLIFDALMESTKGDLEEVLRHIQVVRFEYSSTYREAIATIEPQMHVDAQYQQLTMSQSVHQLPASLRNLNLFQLSGDLVDGNRGIIEFSDFLKRPLDSFKYLLSTCERGIVNIGPSTVNLDAIFIGSSNDIQVDGFREIPDFESFKARIEFIQVPYLLNEKLEKKIYDQAIESFQSEKTFLNHCTEILSRFAVLTRLFPIQGLGMPENLKKLLKNFSPFEKLELYSNQVIPLRFSSEERKIIASHLDLIKNETKNEKIYEGRVGASIREMKNILFECSTSVEKYITPMMIFEKLEYFITQKDSYPFLQIAPNEGYFAPAEYIAVLKKKYFEEIEAEISKTLGLFQSENWEELFDRVIKQVSAFLKNEKTLNPVTKKYETPDESLIKSFEEKLEVSDSNVFRKHLLGTLGAWSMDHPNKPRVYKEIFPESFKKIEEFQKKESKKAIREILDLLFKRKTNDEFNENDFISKFAQTNGYPIESVKNLLSVFEKNFSA